MTDMLTVISPTGATKKGYDAGLSDEELLHCYSSMLRVRAFDEICLKLQRSGRIGFSIPNLGIEATQVGACLLYTSPSPRDLSTSRMPSSA